MNYQTMQFQAREKQQQLQQTAQNHRLARQAGTGQDEPSRLNASGRLAAAIIALTAVAAAVIASV